VIGPELLADRLRAASIVVERDGPVTVTPVRDNGCARRRVNVPGTGHHLTRGSDVPKSTNGGCAACPFCHKAISHITALSKRGHQSGQAPMHDKCADKLRAMNGLPPLETIDYKRNEAVVPHDEDAVLARIAKYRLTPAQYKAMLDEQDGRCAICDFLPYRTHDLYIDHNHETGKVRGLLCSNCNTGLGLFKDNPRIVDRAWEYLEVRGSYGKDSK
jgi:hypothetical protein